MPTPSKLQNPITLGLWDSASASHLPGLWGQFEVQELQFAFQKSDQKDLL
jgi:hypothetical protein